MTSESLRPPNRAYSLLRSLTYTPLSDLLRGNLSARLDYRTLIAKADLPPPLSELVERVAKATRLWTTEKLDVAEELIAHFQDGLAAGQPARALAESFGEPRTAARLIHRAKKRGRPLLWRAWVRAAQSTCAVASVAVGLLLCVYIVGTIRVHTGSPKISRDHVAEYNAQVRPVPESQRAWPLYIQAYQEADQFPEELARLHINPSGEGWDRLVAFSAANAEAIRLYRLAASRPQLGMMLGDTGGILTGVPQQAGTSGTAGLEPTAKDSPALLDLRLPNLVVFPHAARLLQIHGYEALRQADVGQALADIVALFGMAEHASAVPFVISDVYSISFIRNGLDLTLHLLSDHAVLLSESQLIELSHRLVGLRGNKPWRPRIEVARFLFEDFLQRYYSDDGHGDGYLVRVPSSVFCPNCETEYGWALPMFSLLGSGRRELLAEYDRHMGLEIEESSQPLWQRGESRAYAESVELTQSSMGRLRYMPLELLWPHFSRMSFLMEAAIQERDAVTAAIALELYHRRAGAYPVSLEELTPRLLPTVPLDRYDGKPIKYRLIDERPVLYSIGVDRDDDGGRLPEARDPIQANILASNWRSPDEVEAAKSNPSAEPIPDGDWILWPPADRYVKTHTGE